MRKRINQDLRTHINLLKHFVIIALMCLVSCKAQKETQLNSGINGEMTLIAQDGYSGIDKYETMVVRDSKSLNKFYARINKTRKPGLLVPVIDFSKEIVLIVCLGEQKGQMIPKLSKTEESEREVLIAIEMVLPKEAKSAKNQSVSYPFFIYKIPHTSKTLSLEKLGW
ncbi:hypothetical protein [Flagellimonas sp. CMM7]|uniref:hypothetical protein n=1 Tax=Flagellimonas sp. CMM7 TaxID=2654676 RepID=UPI0013D2B7E0|nr:hypothetical protein [Flagellimonas sp. CMM7]UII79930.1 hypothetical protein LV704_00055 [Flagellimonas sp. CMM7]